VRGLLVLGGPLVGGVTVRAEHGVLRHHRQQGAGDGRLARVGDGLEGPVAGTVRGCEKLFLPVPPAARRHRGRSAPAQIVLPSLARRRGVSGRVAPVPEPFP
jgi:hypothetical protein